MTLFLTFAILAAIALVYVFVVRPLIRNLPVFVPFFDWIEPIEARLWRKSRTILVARLYEIAGILLAIHDLLMPVVAQLGFDWTALVPYPYSIVVSIGLYITGWLFERLRQVTTAPVERQ